MFNGMVSRPNASHAQSVWEQKTSRANTKAADGAIGGTAQKVGGPFDKDGMIGKAFNADGGIGGTAQKLADKNQ